GSSPQHTPIDGVIARPHVRRVRDLCDLLLHPTGLTPGRSTNFTPDGLLGPAPDAVRSRRAATSSRLVPLLWRPAGSRHTCCKKGSLRELLRLVSVPQPRPPRLRRCVPW